MVKIMVVEDQARNMRLVEQIIMEISEDIMLLKATSGYEALEIAKTVDVDLVLMDIALPDMDGIQITNKLRTYPQYQHVPFIAVTAYATPREKENIDKIFQYYISKPIDENVLIETIKRVLGLKF